ncbi:hypothetical protein RFI_33719 [Reticulomyxa filosa]|uniref:PD(D/E)XK endonuclease domain-containing protein n=1 Tax=Reticulomyxa filosa TaxID=46433 RepID=X6LP23_RETFI|nr:hypothetical protein RFI_33719 [Reticulomyxa filosa]|eukprot:ETO03683.1 hypothetical protein RFI_33719 [Reticulomyxa filosa]
MKYIGKYGEYRVLACLLEQDVEVYQAIKTNQADYDLTVVLSPSKVVRIQVKSTELNNKSTNNPIDVDKEFDFLVVVILDENGSTKFYVMSKNEAVEAKGTSKKLGTTKMKDGKYYVKNEIASHENQWEKIKSA